MSAPPTADEIFIAELNERLFVHFTHGRWRAPLSDRLCPVRPFDGPRMGRIACAGPADIAAALAGLFKGVGHDGAGDGAPSEALMTAYARIRPEMARIRRLEGAEDPAAALPPVTVPAAPGPLLLLSAANMPVALLAAVLIACAPRGVLWKPAPGAAASAHRLMAALGPASAGRLAMVQGDHATGRAMGGSGAVIWASDTPVPDGLAAPLLSLSAKG